MEEQEMSAGPQTKQPSTLLLNQRVVELRGGCGSARSQAETPDSTDASTPFSGRNELFRVTSFRKRVAEAEFWGSLPHSCKAHLFLSVMAAACVLAYCIQQFILRQELMHIILAELVAALMLIWLAVEAVYHENAFELLASAVVACCISARLVYFIARHHLLASTIAICTIVLLILALDLCMAVASYGQFGWRVYSKIACDLRAKDGKSKQHTFLLIHGFLTLLKLDVLLLVITGMAGLCGGIFGGKSAAILTINPVGVIIGAAWIALVFMTVRNDWAVMELPVILGLPLCYVMPIFDIVTALSRTQSFAEVGETSMVVSALLFISFRFLVVVFMQILVSRFRFLHMERMQTLSDANKKGTSEDVPPQLAPLMRGAWIGKPSANAQKKRRFFQLSSDGSTLRWAWDKYILLYYVEAQINDEAASEITLQMAMEPKLRLRFSSYPQYCEWKTGLEVVRQLLEQPSCALGEDTPGNSPYLFTGTRNVPHGLLRTLLLEGLAPGKQRLKQSVLRNARWLVWCKPYKRQSTRDPKQKRFEAARQTAQKLHALGVDGAIDEESRASGSVNTALSADLDPRQKRGSTIPSIQEFLDAIKKQQEQSPEKPGHELQRKNSVGKKWKELVIDCISPNTKHVHLSFRGPASPSLDRPAARQLFPDKAAEPGVSHTEKSLLRLPSGGVLASSSNRFSIPAQHRGLAASGTILATLPPGLSAQPSPAEAQRGDCLPSEAIDSRECLDTVGPLPGDASRPSSAISPAASPPRGPPTLLIPAASSSTEAAGTGRVSAAQERAESAEATCSGTYLEPERKTSGDANLLPFHLHAHIQRTRTTSSSGSFLGQSPLASRASSGNYTSDAYSYAASLPSQSTISSSVSLFSNGPVKMSVPFIPIQEISIGRCLGEGSEGVVYAGSYLETPVAIKQLSHVQEMEMNLHIGSHDNVVALRGISRREDNLILVTEYCPKGTLHLLLHGTAQSELDPFKLASWVRAIARGMLHLHTRKPPILHRDLKPANIFVGHGFVMKIGDFGMSRHISLTKRPDGIVSLVRQLSTGVIGTAHYAAPELMNGFDDDDVAAGALSGNHVETILKSDVYSFGVTLWEMISRKRPFSDMMGYQIQHAWMEDPGDMVLPPNQMPSNLSPQAQRNVEELLSLVQDCTQIEASKRPSFHEICLRLKHLPSRSSSTASPVANDARSGFLH